MTQSIREKAIEAMAQVLADRQDKLFGHGNTVHAYHVEDATVAFDAAIKVLMEPDEAMLGAGMSQQAHMLDDYGMIFEDRLSSVFSAMLKAASL